MRDFEARYHTDGSINFDFYRRRAARLRRVAWRALTRRFADRLGAAVAAFRDLAGWRVRPAAMSTHRVS